MSSPKRGASSGRAQFSLRVIFVLMLGAAIVSSVAAGLRRKDARERNAAATIIGIGGNVRWANLHPFSSLPRSSTCVRVDLQYTCIHSRGLVFLTDLPNVRRLQLSGASVTDGDLAPVSKLCSLEFLNLGSAEVTDDGLRALESCKRLKTLLLSQTTITGRGLSVLSQLPRLECVVVDGDRLEDLAFRHLAECKALRLVEIGGNRLTDDGLARLADLTTLEELIAVGEFNQTAVERLLASPRLRRLSVRGRHGYEFTRAITRGQ